jgi:hypothetical protein
MISVKLLEVLWTAKDLFTPWASVAVIRSTAETVISHFPIERKDTDAGIAQA